MRHSFITSYCTVKKIIDARDDQDWVGRVCNNAADPGSIPTSPGGFDEGEGANDVKAVLAHQQIKDLQRDYTIRLVTKENFVVRPVEVGAKNIISELEGLSFRISIEVPELDSDKEVVVLDNPVNIKNLKCGHARGAANSDLTCLGQLLDRNQNGRFWLCLRR